MTLTVNYVRYLLCSEAGFIVGLLGIFISLVTFVISIGTKRKIIANAILVISSVLLVALSVNYIAVKLQGINYVEVLDLKELNYDSALMITKQQHLKLICDPLPAGSDNKGRITAQSLKSGEIVPEDTEIKVSLEFNTSEASTFEQPETGDEKPIVTGQFDVESSSSNNDLGIKVKNLNYFYDGYYYTYQIPGDSTECFINYAGKGIYGDIEWSRQLTEMELDELYHGGTLTDSEGNVITDFDGDSGEFFLTADHSTAHFASRLPKGLSKGTYTYVLRVIIGQKTYEYSIPIEVYSN